MDTKNTPSSNDPKKKSSSKLITLGTAAMIAAGVFSTNLNYSQQPLNDTLKDFQKKNRIEFVEKQDSLEHEKIMQMKIDTIFTEYGKEKGMEIIREHMLIEINHQRQIQNEKFKTL